MHCKQPVSSIRIPMSTEDCATTHNNVTLLVSSTATVLVQAPYKKYTAEVLISKGTTLISINSL
jgi:hypothetical protein